MIRHFYYFCYKKKEEYRTVPSIFCRQIHKLVLLSYEKKESLFIQEYRGKKFYSILPEFILSQNRPSPLVQHQLPDNPNEKEGRGGGKN